MRYRPLSLITATFLLAGTAFAQTTTKVIFIGDSAAWGGPSRSGDGALLAYLRSRYGAANVTYLDTEPVGTVRKSTILGYDVAVLSSTPSSARYRNILHDSPTPIVNLEEAVADDSPVGLEFSITAGRTMEVEVDHKIVIKTAHPITAGFRLNTPVQIMSGTAPGQQVWWSTAAQASGSTSLAADDDTATNLFLSIVDVGATLLDTNRKAECRRVMFGLTDRSFNSLTADGKKLFGQAVDWAAGGCCAQASSYGAGLAGKNGVPSLTVDKFPKWGTTVNLVGTNSSGVATAGVLVAGKQAISAPIVGGTLLVLPNVLLLPFAMPASGFRLPWGIPDESVLCGRVPRSFHEWRFQMMQLDPAAAAGWSFTPGLRVEFGK